MNRLNRLAVPMLLLGTACSDSTSPGSRQSSYAIINVAASSETPAGALVRPTAAFFRSDPIALPTSLLQVDACEVQPITAGVSASLFLDAGDSIVAETSMDTAFLRPPAAPASPIYTIPAPGLSVTLGTAVKFTIPGDANGFPASSITARTAESFEFSPISASIGEGENLALTWTPRGDATSTMLVYLQYASSGSPTANSQVFCSLVDDGSHTISATLLDEYQRSSTSLRVNRASRLRTTLKILDNAVLLVIATFDVAIQDAP